MDLTVLDQTPLKVCVCSTRSCVACRLHAHAMLMLHMLTARLCLRLYPLRVQCGALLDVTCVTAHMYLCMWYV